MMNYFNRKFLVLSILLLLSGLLVAAAPIKDKLILKIIMENIENNHYAPKPINDDFSRNVYITFIKQLDPNKQFFTQEDIQFFKKFETDIDDETKHLTFEFYDAVTARFYERINQIEKFYPIILKTPFNFSKADFIETNPDKLRYAANGKALRKNWQKQFKYRTLITYFDIISASQNVSSLKKIKNNTVNTVKLIDLSIIKFDTAIEHKARQKVAKNTKYMLDRIIKNKSNLKDQYFNTIASVFDPHTNYFPPAEKENFDISMSGKLEGIGAVLSEEEGYIKVVSIVPGSAAYRQKELEVEDIIIKVAEGNLEPVDIEAMNVQDAVKLIRGKKGTEVRLTVKKPDGRITVIPIIRDIVIIEETYVKSSIIKSKSSNKTYGYIVLPKFYRDFTNNNARNSTQDMAKELEKLKKANVDGIILDLRNNGGGSLKDAIDIAGLFIEEGPVVQVRNRNQKVIVYQDEDETLNYDGPLIILINNFSASASEILSAALQDYKRAVIVGTSSSFGKGTVQTFIDLDDAVSKIAQNLKPLGSLKLTIQQFFRINGHGIQFKGVVPDITLPDSYSFIDIGEKKLSYSLDFTTANATEYTLYKQIHYPFDELKIKSQKRVKDNKIFNQIMTYGQLLKQKQDHTLQSLNFSIAKKEQSDLRKQNNNLKNVQVDNPNILIQNDATTSPSITEWYSQIKKDYYLDEAINVLNDILEPNIKKQ